jgi:outer membrane protein
MTEEFENIPEVSVPEPPKTKKKLNVPLLISMLSLLIAMAVLVLVFMHGKNGNNADINTISNGKMTFAWINTDTIWEKYEFVADVKTDLAKYEKDLQDQYAATVTSFQNEYNDYLKKGTSNQLTLDEQKKTEEQLGKKQQYISELDAQLTQKLVDEKTARNMEVHDTIVNFIARFNKDKKYTFILENAYGGSLLWADHSLEITNEVLKGLNQEYQSIKKSREAKKEEK